MEASFHKVDADHSEFFVTVNVSPRFFGWIFSLGPDVQIVGPNEVVDGMREWGEKVMGLYK